MTVAELRAALAGFDQEAEVFGLLEGEYEGDEESDHDDVLIVFGERRAIVHISPRSEIRTDD